MRRKVGFLIALIAAAVIAEAYFTFHKSHRHGIDWSGTKSVVGSPEPSYAITDVGPGTAMGLNDNGQVAGFTEFRPSHYPGWKWTVFYGYFWQDGRRTEIGTFGGPISDALKISSQGQVLGNADTPQVDKRPDGNGFVEHSYLWSNGRMTDISQIAGYRNVEIPAFAPDGRLLVSAFPNGANVRHVYLYDGRTMADLGELPKREITVIAINRCNQVVGNYTVRHHHNVNGTFSDSHAFLWQRGKLQDLGTLGGAESEATAINDKGQIVGYSDLKSVSSHAFLWDHGKMQDLGALAETALEGSYYDSRANGINNQGQIVGYSQTHIGLVGFLWENGQMKDLRKMIPQNSGWYDMGSADAINERGQIIGDGGKIGEDFSGAYLLTPIK